MNLVMKSTHKWIAMSASMLLSLSLFACEKGGGNTEVAGKIDKVQKSVDDLGTRITKLEIAVKKGGGGRGAAPARQRPARPNPALAYAVPTGNSPAVGPKNAPITIIEGYEFM